MYIENRLFVELWGDRALFTRPELKSERYTYDFITPSAARNILDAIYWHPGMRYVIDRIYLLSKYNENQNFSTECNPIVRLSIKRNEVGEKGSAASVKAMMNGGKTAALNARDKIQQRNSVILKDVHYVVEAHIELTDKMNSTDNLAKFLSIFTRRCQKGQCFTQPYFGCREFAAYFALWDDPDNIPSVNLTADFGLMLLDQLYPEKNKDGSRESTIPCFFHAVMKHGVVQVSGTEVYQ